MSKPLTRKRDNKRKAFFILVVIIVLIAGYFIFRLLNPSVGFRYYEPVYLPSNVSIKARRISVHRDSTEVEQNFRTEDWVYAIGEYKADRTLGPADQNYDPASIKPTCSVLVSPKSQQYRICHWIDYGRINVHDVTFIKSGTFIRSQIPTTLQQPISTAEIDKYVDSFKQKSTIGLPVLRSNF